MVERGAGAMSAEERGEFGEPWFVGRCEVMGIEVPVLYAPDGDDTPWRVLDLTTGITDSGTMLDDDDATAQRILDCVNACKGMEDPAKEIARLRAIEKAAKSFINLLEHCDTCKSYDFKDDACCDCGLTDLAVLLDGEGE